MQSLDQEIDMISLGPWYLMSSYAAIGFIFWSDGMRSLVQEFEML